MKTELITDISRAAKLLAEGELVAIPTETVYGLAADAMNEAAVRKIFTAKGRPQDNPLIVHLAKWPDAQRIAEIGESLTEKLPPRGPLTIVVKAKQNLPRVVTAGLDTVALRCPDHESAHALLAQSGLLLAAPSANISGRPSPTRAAHVMSDLDGRIAAVLDGGDCAVGVESTVVDMTGEKPVILRLGGYSRADLNKLLGTQLSLAQGSEKSPGTRHKHYAPTQKVRLIREGDTPPVDGTILCPEGQQNKFTNSNILTYTTATLFSALREADAMGKDIYAVLPEDEAARDRLYRAAEGEYL